MARPKKDYVIINCRLEKPIAEKLEIVCDEVGLTKTKAVEKAIEQFYSEYKRTGRVISSSEQK